MSKIIDIFVQDVQEALSELQDTEKLLKYLSGEYTPKLERKYILYVKKTANGSETFINVTYFSRLPENVYVSEDAPIVLYSQTSEYAKTYKLIPAEEKYLILKPGGTYKFKITGERTYGQIVVSTSEDFRLKDVRFDLEAFKYFVEYLPDKMYTRFVNATRGVLKKKFAGIDISMGDLIDELSKVLADEFLSFGYLSKMWPKAIMLEDIRILREKVDICTKGLVLKQINGKFEKLLRTIKKIKLLQE